MIIQGKEQDTKGMIGDDGQMHSQKAGGVVYIYALPTEVRSKVRVLRERGHVGQGGKATQKERGSGAGIVDRWEGLAVVGLPRSGLVRFGGRT